jgi:hypothetical protein
MNPKENIQYYIPGISEFMAAYIVVDNMNVQSEI